LAEQIRKKARGKQPISRHPLFPAIVALWFAALFAVASLAFAPPLGTALRVALVLAAAAVGGLLGARIARRLSGPHAPAAIAGTGETAADGDGETPLWSELKTHRRALATGGHEAEADLPEPAPITERPPEILHLANVDTAGFETGAPAPAEPPQDGRTDDPAPPAETASHAAAGEPAPHEEAAAVPAPAPTAAERIAAADLDALSHVELLERLALSMQRRNHRVTAAIEAMRAEASDAERGLSGAQRPADGGAHAAEVVFPAQAARRSAQRAPASPAPAPTQDPDLRPFDAPGAAAGPQSAEDTEKALRTALAALQRMSGTA
jgi:hypothetical protein